MSEPISIIEVDVDNVGYPRNDGTRGSALYSVPIRLSRALSAREAELIVQFWDHPSSFTTMHRPGIARMSGTSLVLDGTTVEEVRDTHFATIKLAVAATNEKFASETEAEADRHAAEATIRTDHEANVRQVASEIQFN